MDVCEQGAELLNEKRLLGRSLLARARILFRLNKFQESIKTCDSAKRTLSQISPNLLKDLDVAECQFNKGTFLSSIGEWQQAINEYHHVITIYKEVSDMDVREWQQLNIDTSLFGNYEFPDISIEKFIANCYMSIACCCIELGELEKAQKLLEDAFKTFNSFSDNREICFCKTNLGVVYTRLGQYERAIELLYGSRREFGSEQSYPEVANTELVMATIFIKTGDYDKALDLCEQAQIVFKSIGMKENIGLCYRIKAEIYQLQGAIDKALQSYKDALKIIIATTSFFTYECEYGIGICLWEKRNIRNAFLYFQRAIKHTERLRNKISFELQKMSFMNDKMKLYRDIVLICLQLNKDDAQKLRIFSVKAEAFKYVEHAKCRSFCEILGLTEIKPPRGLYEKHPELFNNEKECLNKIMEFQIKHYQLRNEPTIEYGEKFIKINEELNKIYEAIESISNIGKEYISLRKGKQLTFEEIKECLR